MRNNKRIFGCLLIIIILVIVYAVSFFIDNEKYTITEAKEVENILMDEETISKVIKVDIKGAVKNPGVYEIDSGARVIDVINIAGGVTKKANTNYINLAKTVENEMIIWIYTNEEIEDFKKQDIIYKYIDKECNCPSVSTSACIDKEQNNSMNELLNINKATKEELMTLPGLGESKALSIIEYRNNTPFTRIEDIKNVSGIGDSVFEKIKSFITV